MPARLKQENRQARKASSMSWRRGYLSKSCKKEAEKRKGALAHYSENNLVPSYRDLFLYVGDIRLTGSPTKEGLCRI